MLTTGEQQELCQIGQGLRDAALASTLLRLVAVAGRLLMTFAEGAVLMAPAALVALGDAGWPDWEPGQASRHSAGPAQDRPWPGETGPR